MGEWIKITDAESIPLGVSLWLFNKRCHQAEILVPMQIFGKQEVIALLYSHYMHVQAPPPPEEEG